MALSYIPKIEWLNGAQVVDTTITSPILINIPDTSLIEVGMLIIGAGIPSGSTVVSKTAGTVTISNNATATTVGVAIIFKFILEFDYPNKKDPFGLEVRQAGKVTVAKSGKAQILTDYIFQLNQIVFSFMTDTVKETLEFFLVTHGMRGREFKYFTDKADPATERTVTLDNRSLKGKFKMQFRSGSVFNWEVKLKFREVL